MMERVNKEKLLAEHRRTVAEIEHHKHRLKGAEKWTTADYKTVESVICEIDAVALKEIIYILSLKLDKIKLLMLVHGERC
jgi:hypothetical protein